MQADYFNEKYHMLSQRRPPNSWLSSFNYFKKLRASNILLADERPPYPIIIDNPTIGNVYYNLNKSDVLVFSSILTGGFLASLWVAHSINSLSKKFIISKYLMSGFMFYGLYSAMNCSYYRLIGMMDNGLRWKKRDLVYCKYDMTRDFEARTIFKHFRERND